MLADALGSVGVIFSSVLIHFFGWHISDPICSIIISVMILASVQPLIRETVMILLQRVPEGTEGYVKETLQNILKIEGVLGYRNAHFWEQLPGSIVASIHLHIDNSTDEQWLLNRVSEVFLNELGIKSTTIQLEKDAFISQLDIQQRIYTSGLLGSDHFE